MNALRILGELGQGAFGKVFKGMLSGWEPTSAETSQGSTKSTSIGSSGGKEKEKIVAVKTLHSKKTFLYAFFYSKGLFYALNANSFNSLA